MSETMATIAGLAPVIPVLTIRRPEDGVPLAQALVDGGLPALEITLRTPAALDAIAAIADAVPGACVGAGTITQPEQLAAAQDAGARFAVSPGFDPAIADAAKVERLPYLPAVATGSEIMLAQRHGYDFVKFFPAESAGGLGALSAFAGPFSETRFCPTGGIRPENLADYLALPNVVCVGGSWLAPEADFVAGAWDKITARARAAAA